MTDFELAKRRFVIIGVAFAIVLIYTIRLFGLQIINNDYKKNADSNALMRKNEFPSRGVIKDRNNKLLVYNQLTYDLMVIVNETKADMDTTEFCRCLSISKQEFVDRMENIKDVNKNPSYSRFSQQLFIPQLTLREFNVLHEKMFRFPGL